MPKRTPRRRPDHDPHRPAKTSEWVLARLTAPVYLNDAEGPRRPDMVICFDAGAQLIRAGGAIEPDAPTDAVLDLLAQAIEAPAAGRPGKPTSLRTNDEAVAAAVRARFGIAARVGPVPEAEAILEEFIQHSMDTREDTAPVRGYMPESGASEEEMRRFYEAAARLYEAKPWQAITDSNILRVSVPALSLPEAWVAVLGAAGEVFGIGVSRSLEGYMSLHEQSGAAAAGGSRRLHEPMSSLLFNTAQEQPPALIEEQRGHGWPLAGPDAHPLIMSVDADDVSRPWTRELVLQLTALAEAVVAFWAAHGDAWRANTSPAAEVRLERLPGQPIASCAAQDVIHGEALAAASSDPKDLHTPVMQALTRFARADRKLAQEMEAACDYFFRCHWPPPYVNEQHVAERVLGQFMEWFCLDRKSRCYKETPLATFLGKQRGLGAAERRTAELFRDNEVGLFEVTGVEPEKAIIVHSVVGDHRGMRIREKLGTRGVSPGDLFIGRLFSLGNGTFTMSGCMERRGGCDLEAGRAALTRLRDEWRRNHKDLRLSGRDIVTPPPPASDDRVLERRDLERRLRAALALVRLSDTPATLRKRVRAATSPAPILQDLAARARDPDEEWLFEIGHLVGDLWNSTPRAELGGRSPQQARLDEGVGPEEQRLQMALLDHLQEHGFMTPTRKSAATMKQRIDAEIARYMSTPQEALGGLTPEQVIAQERRTRKTEAAHAFWEGTSEPDAEPDEGAMH